MERTEQFRAKDLDEAMQMAVAMFKINEDKIFLSVLEETSEDMLVEALVDINLTLEGKRYLETILNSLGVEYQLETRTIGDKEIIFNIHSPENPLLIGSKGRTLDALQLLVRDMIQSYSEERIIVTLDIGDYREKRKHQLEVLATKTAKEVARTKIEVKLQHMNAYDRRIVHNKLTEWRDVITQSEGTGEERAIVIKPKN